MIGVVLKGYPRLSETFIAQEIAGLEARGFPLHLVSLRFPTDRYLHPVHERIKAPITYLPEYLYQEPARLWQAWRDVRTWPTYAGARRLWQRDLVRDRSANRVRRFGQAVVLAHELRGEVDWFYAHFLHTPASVARYAAVLLGVPWSVSAHAKDVWTIPTWEKREKLADCQWLVTCTQVNVDHLVDLSPAPSRVNLVYHGLDFETFPSPGSSSSERREDHWLEILSVGRAVEKKGYDDLLDALAKLPESIPWRFRHIGGGSLLGRLQARAKALGLDGRIEWLGARPQPEILGALRSADVFVLASRIARGGDRDGLPNVLMEAFSQAVPCVATRISAIPELIEDEVTGLLFEPRDVQGLATALTRILSDRSLRERLGSAGYRRIRAHFSQGVGLDRLQDLLPNPSSPEPLAKESSELDHHRALRQGGSPTAGPRSTSRPL